jgi:LysR family hca operon transcriptional activator
MISAMLPEVELRHLRYFIAVAEDLSFTKAALKLRLAQPSSGRYGISRDLCLSVALNLFDMSTAEQVAGA